MKGKPPSKGDDEEYLSPRQKMAQAILFTQEALECADDPERYDEAEELLAKALHLVPDDETIVSNYVGFCTQVAANHALDQAHDDAIRYFRLALQHAPDDPETWLDLGSAYAEQNMAMEALEAWGQCLRVLNRKQDIYKECVETIGENVTLIARAVDVHVPAKSEKRELQAGIARLIAALRSEKV